MICIFRYVSDVSLVFFLCEICFIIHTWEGRMIKKQIKGNTNYCFTTNNIEIFFLTIRTLNLQWDSIFLGFYQESESYSESISLRNNYCYLKSENLIFIFTLQNNHQSDWMGFSRIFFYGDQRKKFCNNLKSYDATCYFNR